VTRAAAVLDVDGTLVDTNYQHALCWYRAFRRQGLTIPIWRLHRHVGMGGDKFVAAVAGGDVEERHGDELRESWETLFDELIDEVAPLEGARELIVALKEQGHEVVLASSSVRKHFDHFLELLDAEALADGHATKDDVEASKPEPDLVQAALEKVSADSAVMVGDTPWDVEAARKAGLQTVCVITGGFCEKELRDAGAASVFESLTELRERLAETPLASA
jgi:HAD superfamily hydrolase (TIGR01549 family)